MKQKSPTPELQEKQPAPDFALEADGGNTISLADYKGKQLVIYFYPKDDTPGCTQESKDFRDALAEFQNAGAEILGVSKDSVKSHDAFKEKYCLPFPLLSDPEGTMCEAYGVWKEKSMYGKKYMGIERSTFLIDEQGKIAKLWRKVSVPGHVEEVLKAVRGSAFTLPPTPLPPACRYGTTRHHAPTRACGVNVHRFAWRLDKSHAMKISARPCL
jgi:peroxiredoxin Q/BCP